MAVHRHIVTSAKGSEFLFAGSRVNMRLFGVAPEAARIGTLMVEKQLDRPAAKNLIKNSINQRNPVNGGSGVQVVLRKSLT